MNDIEWGLLGSDQKFAKAVVLAALKECPPEEILWIAEYLLEHIDIADLFVEMSENSVFMKAVQRIVAKAIKDAVSSVFSKPQEKSVLKEDKFFYRGATAIIAYNTKKVLKIILPTGSKLTKGAYNTQSEYKRNLIINGDYLQTTCNLVFSSPSAAARFVYDVQVNGYVAWKDQNNRTLDVCIPERIKRGQ